MDLTTHYGGAVIRLVLFDVDGTLIRTGGAGVRAFESTFATEFHAPGATQGLKFSGRTDMAIVRECFQKNGIPATAVHFRRFFDTYVFWLDYWLHQFQGAPCAGISEFMAGLHRLPHQPLLGLLTGNIRLGAEIKLRHYALWDGFRTGAFGDDHHNRNRLARVAHERGETLLGRRLKGKEILVIGDTPMDIECGKHIGARVLAVSTGGYEYDQLLGQQADWVVHDLRGLDVEEICAR